MLTRLVKLTIAAENITSFEEIFEQTKSKIHQFTGCKLLELYRDREDPRIFFTFSRWESAEDLEAYRNSVFFKKVWGRTRVLFEARPEAWSTDQIESIN